MQDARFPEALTDSQAESVSLLLRGHIRVVTGLDQFTFLGFHRFRLITEDGLRPADVFLSFQGLVKEPQARELDRFAGRHEDQRVHRQGVIEVIPAGYVLRCSLTEDFFLALLAQILGWVALEAIR